MKQYPSITLVKPGSPPGETLYTFEKLDGSNVRFEWSKKRGWWKYAARARLLDETDDLLGPSMKVFNESSAEPLTKYFVDQGWQTAVAFCEFYGPRSFAGLHHPGDEKWSALIDVAADKRGIIDPKDYLKLVEKTHVPCPCYLGLCKWNETFLRNVDAGEWMDAGMGFEGVVGKVMKNKRLFMWKAKTDAWRKAVQNKFDHATALGLIQS
jgi:hypothetical protein